MMKNSVNQQQSGEDTVVLLEQIERSRQVISAISDSIQSLIILISLDYKIIFFNKKASHFSTILYGQDLKVGDSFMSYKRDGDEAIFQAFQENFNKAIATGGLVLSEREVRYHDVACWFKAEYIPVYDQGKIIGVALRVIDISEQKQKEKQIEKQNEQLWNISWIQSHLTRQPIATILGLIHILDKTSLTEDNKEIIRMLEVEVGKLDAVVRDTVIRANSSNEI